MNVAVVALLVVLAIAVPAVLAPSAAATHNCGIDFCPHPDDVFCLKIVQKFLPFLCPNP